MITLDQRLVLLEESITQLEDLVIEAQEATISQEENNKDYYKFILISQEPLPSYVSCDTY